MLHWTACYDDECRIHFSSKDNEFFSKKSKNKRVESQSEPWKKLEKFMNKVLCESNDSEQWKSIWKNEKSTSKLTESWEITHDYVLKKYPNEFKFSKNRKNSDPSFKNWAKKQQIKKKMQQKKYEKLSMKKCRRFNCQMSHKFTWISISKIQPQWINLIVKQFSKKEAYIAERGYWTLDEDYISSKLREAAKKLIEKYMICKPQRTSKN